MTATAQPVPRPDVADFSWSYDPWRERPLRASIAVGLALACAVVLVAVHLPVLVTFALAAAVAGALAPALAPARCAIDAHGIEVRRAVSARRLAWEAVRRIDSRADGLLLSTFETPRRMDAYRALVVPIPGGRRTEIEAALASRSRRDG